MKVHLVYEDDSITIDRLTYITTNADKTAIRVEAQDEQGFEYIINLESVEVLNLIAYDNMPEFVKRIKNALPTKADE